MADLGLLGAIGEGLSSGVGAFNQTSDMLTKRRLAQQQMAIEEQKAADEKAAKFQQAQLEASKQGLMIKEDGSLANQDSTISTRESQKLKQDAITDFGKIGASVAPFGLKAQRNKDTGDIEFLPSGLLAQNEGPKKLGPDQAAYYKKSGEDIAEFESKGGPKAAISSLKKLDDALALISGGKIKTGGIRSFVPEFTDPIFYKDTVGAENLVKSVAAESVKQLFPGAVSDYESKSVIDRIWNRKLPIETNVNNVIRERNRLAEIAKQKIDQYQFFKQQGNSMQGYQGLDPNLEENSIDPNLFKVVTKETVMNKKKPATGLLNNVPQTSNAVTKPKIITQNGITFTFNEKTGQYE